ncbi:MAG: hypothetical protein ACTSYL_03575 [Candidatus Thorarchaeota archaeon]
MSEDIESVVTDEETKIDVTSLFRGTATVAFVTLISGGIAALGSIVAYVVSRPGGIIENISTDTAIFLLLLGAMITLFFFLGAIGFFVRANRRLGRSVIGPNLEAVDLSKPGVKTVIIMYGLAVGLILIMGLWGYWLIYKYYLITLASTSLSFFAFTIAVGIVIMSLLIEIVLIAVGRTATGMVHKVLGIEE